MLLEAGHPVHDRFRAFWNKSNAYTTRTTATLLNPQKLLKLLDVMMTSGIEANAYMNNCDVLATDVKRERERDGGFLITCCIGRLLRGPLSGRNKQCKSRPKALAQDLVSKGSHLMIRPKCEDSPSNELRQKLLVSPFIDCSIITFHNSDIYKLLKLLTVHLKRPYVVAGAPTFADRSPAGVCVAAPPAASRSPPLSAPCVRLAHVQLKRHKPCPRARPVNVGQRSTF